MTLLLNKVYFCPSCHRRIEIPGWLKSTNIKVGGGFIINCGYCKNGQVKINGS